MCGIWAYVNLLSNKKINIDECFQYFMKGKKRGPDHSDFQVFKNTIVGFHRLAVIDLSMLSNQPYILQNKEKTIVFICNGEIYNYKELDKKYHLNVGSSDCLVIPKLYMKLSQKDFHTQFDRNIKGEYAFLLLEFNNNSNTLEKVIAGRDMIGIRPLYRNKIHDESLLFSSEIKSIDFYNKNIEEFPPGNLCTYYIQNSKVQTVSYYNFEWIYNIIQINQKDESYYLGRVRQAVINSVKRRLVADRPIAFLVSGGVDSSLVAGIASKLLNNTAAINTFCCGMKNGTDLKYARMVAKHINSNHQEVLFTKQQGLEYIKDVIYCTETWDTTTIRASVGQYIVSKHIGTKTNCKVVLVGEGPDEVCSSYMFNFYAPNGTDLHSTAIEYVKKLHYFDCRRGDRCVSYWGLEGRVPLLDPEVIEAYWEIPDYMRHPKFKGIEKWWLRKAFDDLDIIPKEVLWRKKEAFSDGVSSKDDSWYTSIQTEAEKIISDEELKVLDAPTKESAYFKKQFIQFFGKKRIGIIPHYWLPKWDDTGKTVTQYMDPSARVLNVYDN